MSQQLKILFIAPYQQNDGWGRASQEYIKSLYDKCDLSVRNVFLGPKSTHIHNELFPELIKKHHSYDAIIQKIIPTLMYYDNRCGINCAISCLETKGINLHWKYRLSLMDKIFTFTNYEAENYYWHDGVHSVGQPVDITKYNETYDVMPGLGGGFKFYFIGENIGRKSLSVLIKAYLEEFSYLDDVSLIIKSDTPENIKKTIEEIQFGMRRFYSKKMYARIIHLGGYLSDIQMNQLHNTCDCFVMPSKGEAFCQPLLDAVGFNKQIIINKNTSMSDIVDENNAWLIDSKFHNVFCLDPPIEDIYNYHTKWSDIDIEQLKCAMSEVFNGSRRLKNRTSILDRFSYNTVGNNIIKCLQ